MTVHRLVVLTIMRPLRPLLRKRRELLTELGRAAAEAVSELVRRGLGDDARPGIDVPIATAGDLVEWRPHALLLSRNLLATIPHSAREPVAAIVRTIFGQPDKASAMAQLRKVADGPRTRFSQATALLADAAEDILATGPFLSSIASNCTARTRWSG